MSQHTDLHKQVDRVVVEGEVVRPRPDWPATPPLRRAAAVARRAPVHLVTTARTVATHERTVTGTKATGRNLWYLIAGAGVVVKHWRDTHGSSRYERMMRAAELAGDREALLEWESRDVAEKARRHTRVMDWVKSPIELAKAVGIGIAAVVALLLVLGIILALAEGDAALVVGPITGVIQAIGFAAWFITVYGAVMLTAGTAGVVAWLWHLGRTRVPVPAWIAPANAAKGDAMVTPAKVVLALRDLGLAPLRNAIKAMEDGGAAMLGPIRIAGCGVEVDVHLPSGTSTADIQGRRKKLAENLPRHEHELFITIPPAPRTVRLWIADPGALDEPIGPSPLVIDQDMTADVYTGRAPWGQTLRGDGAAISLKQRHLLITGLSNQGKTASLRALELWLALDVTTELRIADLKGMGDWHMFDGLATVLIEGPTDEHVIAATEMLEAGVAEMERRIAGLDKDKYPNGVTRDLARQKGSGYHPLFLVVDEAQQAFMCPAKGEDKRPYGGKSNNSRYFMAARKLHNQGRAVNVILHEGTQDPTDQNLPVLVREGAHIRVALALGTESQSRMALGDKAVDGGASPHLLRAGIDKGTVVANGDGMDVDPGQSSLTVRTFFIDGDAATEIAERAKAARRRAGRAAAAPADVEAVERDTLADVATVLDGRKRMQTTEVLQRLAELDDSYLGWNAARLDAALPAGAGQYKTEGKMQLGASRVAEALSEREGPNLHVV